MREIIFDTETTGLDFRLDRIIEIGCLELIDHFPTGRSFHVYINAQGRPVHPDALQVHGITDEFLADKPTFAQIAGELQEFFGDATLIAHNATFDISFINAEFERIGIGPIGREQILDTLVLARRRHPMGPNSLDALCRRYNIDNGHRTKHGALLDAELLAEVYIEMIGGRQTALGLEVEFGSNGGGRSVEIDISVMVRERPLPPRLTEFEQAAHARLVERLGKNALWRVLR
ncbi:DNA polymerase III subunit epsilon [Rhizobium sp. EC-SD404]|uniref:DNA polymerase III subunit epsilon n=1 Tax=Rhizobium sp. EC-SD404 TaxID=2038389 RepID=UPI001253E2E4|nr:DNA polymerase III subunit epsilon [Rhizobium sp. EC-SD404]VVS99596.1 DNA polymerase III subunit epsilon [Rhizobium sp. EC-SD404]